MTDELKKILGEVSADTRLSKAARVKFAEIVGKAAKLECCQPHTDMSWTDADIEEVQELVTLGYLDWSADYPARRAVVLSERYFDADFARQKRILNEVGTELLGACVLHPPLNSVHEAYAVLLEEVEEFWDEARKKNPDPAVLYGELKQIAAMACRSIKDLGLLPEQAEGGDA